MTIPPGQACIVPRWHPSRRGSFLFLAIGILVCIVLFSAQYFQYMMRQKKLQSRGGEHQVLSRLAYSLATLAAHKIRIAPQLLRNPAGERAVPEAGTGFPDLFEALAQPLPTMADERSGSLVLDDGPSLSLDFLVNPLMEPLAARGTFSHHIGWEVRREDFQLCGLTERGYPREKKGLIRLTVSLTYNRGGSYSISEQFRFAVRVKVASLLTPVLSKFSLYVENAATDARPHTTLYNQVSVDFNGSFSKARSKARPLICDNDGEDKLPIRPNYQEFVKDPRGLIYLGGPSWLILNLARSDINNPNPDADSGEGFHSYRDAAGWGWIPRTRASNGTHEVIALDMEQGASDDPNPRATGWYDRATSAGFLGLIAVEAYRLKLSSIFRLFGVQSRQSPTLVLGNVLSGFLRIRGYTTLPPPPPAADQVYRLPCLTYGPPHEPDTLRPLYREAILEPPFDAFRAAFRLSDSEADYFRYTFQYGSFIGSRSYNLGLAYLHDRTTPFPERSFPPLDPLSAYLKDSPPDNILHAIPPDWKPAAPDATDLKDMQPFLQVLTSGGRRVYEIPADAGDIDLWTALQRRGLVSKGKLALDGWVFVKKPMRFELPARPIRFLSSGGFIVEEGDIVLRRDLEPAASPPRKNCLLGLVALKGDIVIDTPAGAKIHAFCVANGDGTAGGHVLFRGGPANLTGALAMRRLFKDPGDLKEFAGPELSYFQPLAAIPGATDESRSEKQLLTYQVEELPFLVQ